ncbi:MAG: hypothetical protein CMN30_09145 [Sandaracinus sp.]|nr:hypothetical protein [Sandaracinus sp.]|tara:strand:- start:1053 stop:1949 length:897 start_codon:yes stop_codon:yes gene_type:complete
MPSLPGLRPRDHWARRISALDPAEDFHAMYRMLVAYEFPWDATTALSFALFRTYAVPSIGGLLHQTGELTERTRKRYDDTVLLMEAVVEDDPASERGRRALRRINRMHAAYDIAPDDMRYVLSTFVVAPVRWIDRYGWRRLTAAEREASARHYREVGRHMGIRAIPADYDAFATFMDEYERAHFAFHPGARAVAEATLSFMGELPYFRRLPGPLVRRAAFALMDDALLDAFRFPRPTAAERRATELAMAGRRQMMRRLPSRTAPGYHRSSREVRKTYPHGFALEDLGTFPAGCPVPHP